ncbi:Alpha/Beta hydrolase protein [Tuber borchii]|uniref:Alpha/Beta hydrolase protein n=1 Tax=Tuber borchii TaxID=42251 RepID=A0A2T7A8J0_TUBBO|nr:Alpha/Beta hydrolase protein [Tuber borchii]
MLLGQVSWPDILVFVVFLTWRLLRDIGIYGTVICAVQALPFLCWRMPIDIIKERYLTKLNRQSAFTRRSTLFQALVVACMRYGFACVPTRIGRVFFTKGVALPFLRFRMFRHGYFWRLRHRPLWREINLNKGAMKGIWIVEDDTKKPDVVIYYCHGGGFAMGTCYFYLEFLISWVSILKDSGFSNPAIFAVEYTLIPDKTYPVQLQEIISGYNHVLSITGDPGKVVVSGDSAGGTLILSLLLHVGNRCPLKKPSFAALISPWTHIVSKLNRDTPSDFLSVSRLHTYGRLYAGSEKLWNPMVSPGFCMDISWWRKAMPARGVHFYFGSQEIFYESIKALAKRLSGVGNVVCHEDESLHAWPFAVLFLGTHQEERGRGLRRISSDIAGALLHT